MGQEHPALEGLPEPGESVFYPKVGHCIYRGVTEDRVAPGTQLLELEDLEEGSRILIPLGRVPELNLRAAGTALDDIKEVLSSDFEEPLEDEEELHALVEKLITDGSPRALAQSLKRLHLLRQTTGLSREEELTRKKIRSWLAAEVAISRECTRAEAQAFMTRVLQESMAEHQRKEKEEAKQRRKAAREQKAAETVETEDVSVIETLNTQDVSAETTDSDDVSAAETLEKQDVAETLDTNDVSETETLETQDVSAGIETLEKQDVAETLDTKDVSAGETAEDAESAEATDTVETPEPLQASDNEEKTTAAAETAEPETDTPMKRDAPDAGETHPNAVASENDVDDAVDAAARTADDDAGVTEATPDGDDTDETAGGVESTRRSAEEDSTLG